MAKKPLKSRGAMGYPLLASWLPAGQQLRAPIWVWDGERGIAPLPWGDPLKVRPRQGHPTPHPTLYGRATQLCPRLPESVTPRHFLRLGGPPTPPLQ